MRLEYTNLVELEYREGSSLLYARWPDNSPLMTVNFEQSFLVVINTINCYNIQNFLLDSSGNRNNLSETGYQDIFSLLFSGLAQTGLKKMARIQSQHPPIEEKFARYHQEIRSGIGINFEFRNFESREAAEVWLRSKE